MNLLECADVVLGASEKKKTITFKKKKGVAGTTGTENGFSPILAH